MQQKLEQVRDILKSIEAENEGILLGLETALLLKEIQDAIRNLRGLHLLTVRELEVFERIGHGKTVKEIATELKLSAKTIETFRDRMREKLGIATAQKLNYLAFQWVANREPVKA